MRRRQQLIISCAKSEVGEGEGREQENKKGEACIRFPRLELLSVIVRLKFIHFSHNLTFNRYQENLHTCKNKYYIDY